MRRRFTFGPRTTKNVVPRISMTSAAAGLHPKDALIVKIASQFNRDGTPHNPAEIKAHIRGVTSMNEYLIERRVDLLVAAGKIKAFRYGRKGRENHSRAKKQVALKKTLEFALNVARSGKKYDSIYGFARDCGDVVGYNVTEVRKFFWQLVKKKKIRAERVLTASALYRIKARRRAGKAKGFIY